MEKCGTAGQVTDDNVILRMRFAGWMSKAAHTHTHTHMRARVFYVIIITLPQQQWFRECVSMHFVHCL
jgi:hypothetical protein